MNCGLSIPFMSYFPLPDATTEVTMMENAEVVVFSPVVMFTIHGTYSNKLQGSYGRGTFKESIQKSSFFGIYSIGYRMEFRFE